MPARAEAQFDLQGRFVRARAAAPSMEAAADEGAERLQRHVRRYVERLITREREPAAARRRVVSPLLVPPRAPTFVRPAEDREITRRKSFASGPMSAADAADVDALDHDFFLFLFRDAETDTERLFTGAATACWRRSSHAG